MASLRYERRISAPADEVWRVFSEPHSIPEWFPWVVSCTMKGNVRVLTLATGIEVPEEILVVDPLLRRFAYRMTSPLYTFHLATIDAIELGERESLCVYSTTAEPDTLALLTGGGTAHALVEIARVAEERARG
jgi:uncharacterized protein YndB with AHSA1/START domain